MTGSYKSFRKEGFSVRPDVYYRKKNGEPMTADEKQARDMDVEKQSREDFSSLLELRDIFDELHTIKKLFKEQRETLLVMARNYLGVESLSETQDPTKDLTTIISKATEAQKLDAGAGLNYLQETWRSLNSFERKVLDMIERAENTEKAVSLLSAAYIASTDSVTQYSNLLDIKQKQASVDESRLARSQMDATAAQGRAIMVFTVFTIIFVRLRFCS